MNLVENLQAFCLIWREMNSQLNPYLILGSTRLTFSCSMMLN
ncbi:hypothetical protein Godav_012041, partial [Gossypium davidsonii]|nr:hypothetical protein [Gossypium davidsonii]